MENSMLELNKTYVVKDKKVRVTKYKTRLGKLLLLVDVNSSTCYVPYEDAKRKGILRALSDMRRFNSKLTIGQYNMIGTAIHHLSAIRSSVR